MAEKSTANELMTHCHFLEGQEWRGGKEKEAVPLKTRGSLKDKRLGSFKMYMGLEGEEIPFSQAC